MFAVLRRLGVVLVVAALALSVGPASAWASGLSRAQTRELRLYESGLVLARSGAGPALRKAGGVKLANALPIWRVPSGPALRVLPGLMRSNLVSVVAADQPLLPIRRIRGFDLMIEDFEIVDPVECAPDELVAAELIAAEVNHAPAPPRANSAVWRVCVRRITYWTVMRNVESLASTWTASSAIRSPSHC